jgi:hypothetical protein
VIVEKRPLARTFGDRMGRLGALVVVAGLLLLPKTGFALDLDRLQKLCASTAGESASALAKGIAGRAMAEHAIFGGHVIDARGRLVRIGSHESATASGARASPQDVPWRNVLRYWETLSGRRAAAQQAAQALTVFSHPGILSAPAGEELARRSVELQTLLAALAAADLTHTADPAQTREALLASAIRASMADVPWSAAFVSAVLVEAGVPRTRFAFSPAHMEYIAQAVRSAGTETSGAPAGEPLYRACDPYKVAPRPGDLLCYHRHDLADAPPAGSRLFSWTVRGIADGTSPVWRSHCDIVTEVDRRASKVRTVGGNVQQSVALRSLNLNGRLTLSPNQGGPACADAPAPAGATPDPCSLNAQPWFVLLQLRGP